MKIVSFALLITVTIGVFMARPNGETENPVVIDWQINNVSHIGGHRITVLGKPEIITSDHSQALLFDGEDDGIIVESNPLAGARRFTVEVVFRPDPGGAPQQRFLHFQSGENRRALVETRLEGEQWFLDTFLKFDEAERTLQARDKLHPLGEWFHAALVYDGRAMHHYVNGIMETSGPVDFSPLRAGQMSIGCRLNRVFWFKGAIRRMRVTHSVLRPEEFLPKTNTD
ncbi:MAG: LamG domain-containing protein [Acidobacteria bacterium]|nr:MAG: LamG domain-containing protein [Acidobacteriota bacterium]